MFISNKNATFRGGISYHFKGMFNYSRSITSADVVVTLETFVVAGAMDVSGITALSSMTTKTTVQSIMDTTGVTVTGSME